jgi:nitroreductase
MDNKYDIAIIGLGVGANYGSVLTYYALYKSLESLGKNPLLVSKIGANKEDFELQDIHSIRFAKEHYNLSEVYSLDNISNLNDLVDGYVVGSDQVFNYGVSKNFGKSFYLDFAADNKLKISYASSFGHQIDFAPSEEIPRISELFGRFNAISVREDSGVTLAKDVYGVPAVQVSEPIFLLDNNEYAELAARSLRDCSKPYILAYILDPTPEKKAAIINLANELMLEVKIVLDGFPNLFQSNLKKTEMEECVERDVETYDFLKLYMNASYIFTDSFHGTCFALKFQKPFVTIGNKRRGMARFNSLFRIVSETARFTTNPTDIIDNVKKYTIPVDYRKVTQLIERHVHYSKQWLKDSLEIPVDSTIASKTSNLKELIGSTEIYTSVPKFISNKNLWNINNNSHYSEINLSSISDSIQGNLIWCDLPCIILPSRSYRISIDWNARSASKLINFHIRNPISEKFIVIGAVKTNDNERAIQSVDFTATEEGYTQFMLGAVHFSGIDSGATVYSISIREISESHVINSMPARKTSIDTVREFSRIDSSRFIKFYAQDRIPKSLGNARSLMIYYAHGFEKGLSRTKDFRPGFGSESMKQLTLVMNDWIQQGNSPQDSHFLIALSVMRSYFDRHAELNFDVSHFFDGFSIDLKNLINSSDASHGGAIPASAPRDHTSFSESSRDFLDVVFSRRSIRMFNSDSVSDEVIKNCITMAIQSPSVCNRQPARVHIFEDQDLMTYALKLQGGWNGYENPPKLLLITSDLTAYVNAVERNQAFIDGGLFMMSLLLSLEYHNLGVCCLNTAMTPHKEAVIRDKLSVPDSQVFISFLAVGHYDKDILVPRSKRLDVSCITVFH